MRMLVISLNYAPEATGFAPHSTALSEYLVERGHQVTVITGFPFAPYWKRSDEHRGRVLLNEARKGVNVWRVTHFIPRRARRAMERILMEGTFGAVALGVALTRIARPDLVLYIGAQPAAAHGARAIAAWFGAPLVVKITDLATMAAKDVGILSNRWLLSILNHIEYSAYKASAGAIVLCDAFARELNAAGYDPHRVRVIPDSVDLDQISSCADGATFRARARLGPEHFVILHSGSMGIKQGLMNVVEAAAVCSEPRVRWVMVGEGEQRAEIQSAIQARGLCELVKLMPLQPESEMASMFAAANVLLLNQVRAMKDTVIPSKLLTYMASGRAVLAAVNSKSQAAGLLAESGGGVLVQPEDPTALATAVAQLVEKPLHAIESLGRQNRLYAETHFDRNLVLARQESFLMKVHKAGRTLPIPSEGDA